MIQSSLDLKHQFCWKFERCSIGTANVLKVTESFGLLNMQLLILNGIKSLSHMSANIPSSLQNVAHDVWNLNKRICVFFLFCFFPNLFLYFVFLIDWSVRVILIWLSTYLITTLATWRITSSSAEWLLIMEFPSLLITRLVKGILFTMKGKYV